MRLRRILVFTGLTALGTGLLVYWLLMTMVAPGQVVIAAAGVSERTILTAEMLMTARVPRAGIHGDAIRRIEDAVGQSPMYPLVPGEQVLESKLMASVLNGRISGQLAAGERAMLVPVAPDRAVGGAIAVHDRVDIIFVANSSKLGYQMTKTILSGVEVLDISSGKGGGLSAGAGEGVIVRLSPAAAEELSSAISSGDVFLTLSGYSEAVAPSLDLPQ